MRPEKTSIIEELRALLAESSFVIVTDYRGMKSGQATELRKKLRGEQARLQIVQKNLFLRALDSATRDGLKEAVSGPIAIVVGRGDLVTVSKLLKAFSAENDLPVLKMGVLNGELLSSDDIEALINLPSIEVMRGILVGAIASPMAGLAGVMRRRLESILNVLKAVEEKKAGKNG